MMACAANCGRRGLGATQTAGVRRWRGVKTPTECLEALRAGADGLKIFPASILGPGGIKASRAILPTGTQVYAVGGAGPDNFKQWIEASADGFGIGSAIYKPGDGVATVAQKARTIVAAYDAVTR